MYTACLRWTLCSLSQIDQIAQGNPGNLTAALETLSDSTGKELYGGDVEKVTHILSKVVTLSGDASEGDAKVRLTSNTNRSCLTV